MFCVLFLFEDFDLTTKRSLAIDMCICLNHQELSFSAACLSLCWRGEMKLWSAILSPGQMESQVEGFACRGLARMIRWRIWSFYASFLPGSVFWQNAIRLRDLAKVLHGNVKIFQIWSWTDNNKVYNNLSISSFDRRCPLPNTALISFVLIAGKGIENV